MKRTMMARLIGAAALLLAAGSAASAELTEDERKCLDKIYNDSRKVIFKEQRFNRINCIQYLTGDQTACIDAERPQSVPKRTDLSEDFTDHCNPLPPYGLLAGANAIADIAEGAADDIIRGIWDNPVDGLDGSQCARQLALRSGRLAWEIWRQFRFCAKDLEVLDSITDIETCIATGISVGEAEEGSNVDSEINSHCTGGFPPPGTEDGVCGAETTATAFANCLRNRVDCTICLALSEVTVSNPDCDLLDDGASNLSCGP